MLRARMVLLAAGMSTCSCERGPSAEELARLRAEAQAANSARAAEAERDPRTHPPDSLDVWTLGLFGPGGRVGELDGKALDAMATGEVVTVSPTRPPFPDTPVHFRTIPIGSLLERWFHGTTWPDDQTITFLADDGFRVTIALHDALSYPIGLAVAGDGQALHRAECGPLYLVFPHTQYPELVEKYPDGSWAFYVTSMIVGTEPPRLRVVGGRELDATALRALPRRTLTRPVLYKLGWQAGDVRLTGVALRDILDAAGVHVERGHGVAVRGKAAVHHSPFDPRRIAAEHVLDDDILLVLASGEGDAPIRASLGGPITLAFPRALDAVYGRKYWLTFVEEIEVVP
jgi:hypothetical protein